MVLTDRQRKDLHAGIHEYLLSRATAAGESGKHFADAAAALAKADPDAAAARASSSSAVNGGSDGKGGSSPASKRTGGAPLLEKKWTAVPRLQRKVLELERTLAANARIHAHRTSVGGGDAGAAGGSTAVGERRLIPRPPASHVLRGHAAVVTCVALHPVYTLAASGSEDGTVKLWDHESGEYVRSLKGHTNPVLSVDFSPTGSHLASCSSDLSIKLWDTKEYKCVRTLRGHDHTISAVRFVPLPLDSPALTRGGGGGGGGGEGNASIDAATTGSQHLASASRDATVKFWDVETGFCDHTLSDHTDWVRCLAVRPQAPSSTGSGTAKRRPRPRGTSTGEGENGNDEGGDGGGETAASLSALLASGGNDRVVRVYDAHTRTHVTELRGHDHVVEAVSFVVSDSTPSSSRRTAGGGGGDRSSSVAASRDYLASAGRDRTVRLWHAVRGECLMVFTAHENWVRGVVLHPGGKYVIGCGDDRTVRVFDIKSQRCLRTIDGAHDHFVTSVAIHHALPVMVTGGVDQTVKCWQLD